MVQNNLFRVRVFTCPAWAGLKMSQGMWGVGGWVLGIQSKASCKEFTANQFFPFIQNIAKLKALVSLSVLQD